MLFRAFSPCGQESLHELGVELAGAEGFIGKDLLVQRDRGLDSLHDELARARAPSWQSPRRGRCRGTISLAISES